MTIDQTIRIGTSGYSFKDWKAVFYPENIKDGHMLNYYSEKFDTVEINSTYYRIPHYKVFHYMNEKTPDNFEFIVKFHKSLTHDRKNYEESLVELQESVLPLKENNKMMGYLAQFPYSFKNNESNRNYIRGIRDKIKKNDKIFMEFRHKSWTTEPLYDFMKNTGIGYVCVDEPELPGLLPPQNISTVDTGYIRLHGRNKITWWDQSKGDRYDYHYSAEELNQWRERINSMLDEVKKLYLFFNNCHHGHAVQNALEMKKQFDEY